MVVIVVRVMVTITVVVMVPDGHRAAWLAAPDGRELRVHYFTIVLTATSVLRWRFVDQQLAYIRTAFVHFVDVAWQKETESKQQEG